MDSKLIQYTEEQIRNAGASGNLISITFHENWCGVGNVELIKMTAKCIWPKNTSRAKLDFTEVGRLNYRSVVCIKDDQDEVIDTYYSRVIEEKEKEIADAQDIIAKGRTVMFNREILNLDPESRKWVRS